MIARSFIAIAATCIALPAIAQDQGVETLEAAASAFKEMESLSFQTTQSNSEGSITADIKSDLTVKMVRGEEPKREWTIRYSGIAGGLGTAGDEEGNLQIEVHDDGTVTTWIDFKEEKVSIRRSRLARGSAIQMATYGTQFLDELRAEAPFASAIAEAEITYVGEESLGGVACDVVKIVKGGTNITETWWIGKSDRFPRQYKTGIEQMGETTIQISDVKVNEEIDPADLAIVFPPNFEVDDRGPNRTVANADANDGPAPRRRGTEVGNEAPDFELENTQGETIRLTSLRPNVVVLNFWGSWCLPCQDANDELEKLEEHFSGKPVKVLGLASKEPSLSKPADAMKEHGWDFELLPDATKTARIFSVRTYPTIYVIGREGEILHVATGYDKDESPFAEITKVIEDHLATPPAEPKKEMVQPPATTQSTGGSGTSTSGGGR